MRSGGTRSQARAAMSAARSRAPSKISSIVGGRPDVPGESGEAGQGGVGDGLRDRGEPRGRRSPPQGDLAVATDLAAAPARPLPRLARKPW